MSSLFVIKGRDQGRKFELSEDSLRIGRDGENLIVINDPEASRAHAEIRALGDDEFEVQDLDSSNGTYVNDKKIESQTLKNGDRLRIGKTVLIYTVSNHSKKIQHSDLVKIVQTPLPEATSKIVKSMVADGSIRKLSDCQPEQLANNSLNLVYRTALAVSQTLDIDQLIDKLMEMIFEAIEPDRGCILLYDNEAEEMLPRITRSKLGNQSTSKLEISRSIVDYVVQNQQGILTSDAMNDNRWDSQASIVNMGVCEAICVPMQGRYGTQGVIYVDTRTPPGKVADLKTKSKFTDTHLKLMIAIGHQAALAVEDTNFYSAMIQSERMAAMGQTIAMLSHHIKNILQGINGGSYLVNSGIAAEEMETVQTGWQIVEKNQSKISQLVMDMLSFSKDREPDFEKANIVDTLSEVVELVTHRARENGATIKWNSATELPNCYFDPEAIHRAVLNVVSNAVDALEAVDNGVVEIDASIDRAKQLLEIRITDNAEGIEPENLKKIFGVFESGKGQRGTGLGLPVSKKIMKEHGGDIVVESEIGVGSQFCLFFPLMTKLNNGQTLEMEVESDSFELERSEEKT